MSTARVTARYINKPKGKGKGDFKGDDGRYYRMWYDKMVAAVEVGQTYDVEYQEEETPNEEGTGIKTLHCQVSLMDGSLIEGVVRYPLPPNHERLYDYLNLSKERFAKLYLEDGSICLVNKAYIVCVLHLTAQHGVAPHWLPEAVEISETSA